MAEDQGSWLSARDPLPLSRGTQGPCSSWSQGSPGGTKHLVSTVPLAWEHALSCLPPVPCLPSPPSASWDHVQVNCLHPDACVELGFWGSLNEPRQVPRLTGRAGPDPNGLLSLLGEIHLLHLMQKPLQNTALPTPPAPLAKPAGRVASVREATHLGTTPSPGLSFCGMGEGKRQVSSQGPARGDRCQSPWPCADPPSRPPLLRSRGIPFHGRPPEHTGFPTAPSAPPSVPSPRGWSDPITDGS